ncbi:MAG: Uma2 family endonuclease, partial [Planctomycetota bacterium]
WAPGTKRRPDVAYWHAHQFPDGLPERGEATIAPAWCIEVVSPGDNAEALEEKVAEYFRAGVELVWIVIPATRSVRTERPDGTAHVYRGDQALTADPVLPAFTAPVARLFPKTAATPSASESD